MNRYYEKDKMKETFRVLKDNCKDLKIATHLMVGFPTESVDELKESLEFIKEIDFDEGLLFPFSVKKGSKAEEIEPKIPEDIIKKRMVHAKKFFNNNGYAAYYHKSNFLAPQHFIFSKKQ